MLISTAWLQEYLKKPLSVEQMAQAMESAGIEVESISHGPSLDPKIVVAEVLGVKPHPKADKLKLAEVNNGQPAVQVVCAAPNVAVGQKVAYVPPGAELPDGTKIDQVRIRGQGSVGMIASAKELGLSQDHSGILELNKRAVVGTLVREIVGIGASVIDVKPAANRPDLTGLIGIAREVAAHSASQLLAVSELPNLVTPTKKPKLFRNQAKELTTRYALAKLELAMPLA
ncbi:phenylalanine--tRNA ligase subunit beta, partial [Candidatus Microgenomates bacterium]|nr:phenylalanine--tRNA ligase subunit beta [Candidatus Microgenomates bacterium]